MFYECPRRVLSAFHSLGVEWPVSLFRSVVGTLCVAAILAGERGRASQSAAFCTTAALVMYNLSAELSTSKVYIQRIQLHISVALCSLTD